MTAHILVETMVKAGGGMVPLCCQEHREEMIFTWMQREKEPQKKDVGKRVRKADVFPHRRGLGSTSNGSGVVLHTPSSASLLLDPDPCWAKHGYQQAQTTRDHI